MPSPAKPFKIGNLALGVNNREADTLLTTRAGSFVRAAANADLTTGGRFRRRDGYAKVMDSLNAHSLFSTGERAFMVDGSTLYELIIDNTGMTKRAVRTGIPPHARLSFSGVGEDIVYTGLGTNRRIYADGTEGPLSLPRPNPAPVLEVFGSTYSMTPGLYQVCATNVAADGRMSGSTIPVQIQVAAGQALRILGLHASFPAGVVAVNVYATPPDGDTFMLLGTIYSPADPANGVTITADMDLGAACPTFMLDELPDGQIIRRSSGGGRVLVASGSMLFASDPFAPGIYDPLSSYIQFDSNITVLESTEAATYVATEKRTYRLDADKFSDVVLDTILPYGAVPGSSGTSPDRREAWWMSARGLVRVGGENLDQDSLAHSGESVKNLQEEAISMRAFAEGAALYRESNGIKQIISSLRGAETSGAAAYSYIDAEVIRKGTTL